MLPEIEISPESLDMYTEIAWEYLEKQKAVIDVRCAGVTDSGQTIFGICMKSDDGKEKWYDPEDYTTTDSVVGWNNEEDAHSVLTCRIMPNLGYAIHQRDLQLFHQNMK